MKSNKQQMRKRKARQLAPFYSYLPAKSKEKPIDPVILLNLVSSSHSCPLGEEHSCNHITLLFIIAARRARSGLLPAHAFS